MPIPPLSVMPVDPGDTSSVSRAAERVEAERVKGKAGGTDPYVEFEAFVLQSFVEAMLPKNAESVFGSGTAGGFWKSMLAEKLGMELAKSGGIGLASTVAASRTVSGSETT